MEKRAPIPLPQENQKYSAAGRNNMAKNRETAKEIATGPNYGALKPYDRIESQKQLKELEKLKLHFVIVSSDQYRYPFTPPGLKHKTTSLVSRLLNLKALKQGVEGMIKSIIF